MESTFIAPKGLFIKSGVSAVLVFTESIGLTHGPVKTTLDLFLPIILFSLFQKVILLKRVFMFCVDF